MTPNRKITLAITHYNRFDMLRSCIAKVMDDPRIGEIVIADDCSTDGSYDQLLSHFQSNPKIKIFQNQKNLDCYGNKHQAVCLSANEWVILFDSDNVIGIDYLDRIYALPDWAEKTVYCPDFAQPNFDYRMFGGMSMDKKDVSAFLRGMAVVKGLSTSEIVSRLGTALNTCNYFVNRAEYLRVWDPYIEPHTADSIYQNYRWLSHGNTIHIVKGLQYFHRVHDGSHFKQNHHKTGKLHKQIEERLKAML